MNNNLVGKTGSLMKKVSGGTKPANNYHVMF
jgi:hypothetical protein